MLLCLLISRVATADSKTFEFNIQSLARQATWLKLLHYEKSEIFPDTLKSAVISPEFFNHSDGRFNPEAELQATLDAIKLPQTTNTNKHAQCRFRARYLWLKSQIVNLDAPDIDCPDYSIFSSNNGIDSVSLILATGYLGNPASYYGHTLLKFNSRENRSTLLDESLNYGAIIPPDTNPVSYIFNGVFGGYEGGFTHIRYYFHNHNYGENELRDLWEYELSLTPEESSLIAAHAWELIGIKFDYYFFRRNCAYRTASLLELIDGVDVTPNNVIYTIPQSLTQLAKNSTHHGKPLIRSIAFHPSRQSRLYQSFRLLNHRDKEILKTAINNAGYSHNISLQHQPLQSQQSILDTAMNYYNFLQASSDQPQQTLKDPRHSEALNARFQLPATPEPVTPHTYYKSQSPHIGRNPSRISARAFSNNALGMGTGISLRPAYYDAMDAGAGHVPYGQLSMADMNVTIADEKLSVRHFDLINIESVRPAETGLPGDNGNSWMLRAGLESQSLGCTHCLVARLQADKGKSIKISDTTVISAYLGAAIQDSKHEEGHGFVRATLSATSYFQSFRFGTKVEFRQHPEGFLKEERVTSVTARYEIQKNLDIRFTHELNRASETSISIGKYW